jgi:hypothetical protein
MKNKNITTPKTETFTVRVQKEIVLITSNADEVRKKLAELTKEKGPYFTLSNNAERWTSKYQKSFDYYPSPVKYID